jgi:hypothetical protein
MVRANLTLLLLTLPLSGSAWAQTLSARPAFFADPVLAVDPSQGDLVLGRTTLRSAMLIFATELQDSLQTPGSNNPDTLPQRPPERRSGRTPPIPALRYRLDIGPGHYTLFFDKNERLVAVEAGRRSLPRQIRRDDLVARYATLRPTDRADLPGNLEAPLAPCVSMFAWASDPVQGQADTVGSAAGSVLTFGYRFTCSTKPAERSVMPRAGH